MSIVRYSLIMIEIPLHLQTTAPCLEDEIFADLSLSFTHRPLYRYSFEITEKDVERLIKLFSEQLVRCHRFSTLKRDRHQEAVFRFDSACFVYVYGWQTKFVRIYADSREKAESLQKQLKTALPKQRNKRTKPSFYMLRLDDNEFSTQRVENTAPHMDDEFLRLSYGTDILTWINDFKAQTQAKYGGITLLDGPPGTGKSSLITQMMRRLYKSHVFYTLAVGQHECLTQSGLVQFWQNQTERHPKEVKVVIIEDAEKILLSRGSDNNDSVSALLNIADGLIGQMLKVHLLCTLNKGADNLDAAILRPGRLRSHRHVGLLTRENALAIAAKKKLTFTPDPDRENFSLAEVFNQPVFTRTTSDDARTLGFHIVKSRQG